jgi:hypothetical protein
MQTLKKQRLFDSFSFHEDPVNNLFPVKASAELFFHKSSVKVDKVVPIFYNLKNDGSKGQHNESSWMSANFVKFGQ